MEGSKRVLLTGATGFVGRHLHVALEAAGHEVVGATRAPGKAAEEHPDRRWVRFDLEDPSSLAPAMEGCDTVIYLIHGMRGGDRAYPEREREGAMAFRRAAAEAGVKRIVYLGGVAPRGTPSRHLASRIETGEVLRGGSVPCVELRAAMVIGRGSASWAIVRDLARRLPAMVLPRWLENRSRPVAIRDVVTAILWAVGRDDVEGSEWLDVPGPREITHRELLGLVCQRFGKRPPMFGIPLLSPRLSSYWIALVTRESLRMAQELVEGLRTDLLPSGPVVWDRMGRGPTPLEVAIDDAIRDERSDAIPSSTLVERLREVGRAARAPAT